MAKVLVVEDEGILSMNIEMYLEGKGHEVIGLADNAKTALELAAAHKPDIALVDIVLKGDTDGIKVACELVEKYGCKIIYTTACTDPVTIDMARKARHYGFLTKPFEPFRLDEAMEQALGA